MKRRHMARCMISLVIGLVLGTSFAQGSGTSNKLWYRTPATNWNEALPVGNGRLGAMVFGHPTKERIQFNEDTFWSGRPHDYTNPGASEYVEKARALIFDEQFAEADQLVESHLLGMPKNMQAYQTVGDLTLSFPDQGKITNYTRELDMDEAMARVEYEHQGITFRREIFSSAPDQVIVIRLSCNQRGALNTDLTFDSPHAHSVKATEDDFLVMQGQWMGDGKDKPLIAGVQGPGMQFQSHLKVDIEGGRMIADEGVLKIRAAHAVTMRLAVATSFVDYKDISGDPAHRCSDALKNSEGKAYAQLRNSHVADYQRLFRRVKLQLNDPDASQGDMPTNERLAHYKDGFVDPGLEALYFQFGRYLMISGSRPGTQPLNLQGIWSEHTAPPWGSKYTVNINTEMNYWPAEVTNLAECHEPLFDMLDDIVVTGSKVAKEHYGCGGWVLHHNTDIWRGAAPVDGSRWGMWVTGGAWLSTHAWESYLYSGDVEFLRNRAYPLMKGAARFLLDFLIEHPTRGVLVTSPSNSPENAHHSNVSVCAGPAMDTAIIRTVFEACMASCDILDMDSFFRRELKTALAKMPPLRIGKAGQLQEWLDDWDMEAPEPTHRHVSHLWALHPGGLIDPVKTPALAQACKVTLAQRGDGGTGWSKAWKINFRARLHQGNYAHKMLAELLKNSTHPNLFDVCPPFQIDGNFGGCAGIAEMLLQSDGGIIELLPALPEAWGTGFVEGLRARGGLEVDIKWDNHVLTEVALRSKTGKACVIRYGEKTVKVRMGRGEKRVLSLKDVKSSMNN